VAQGILPFPEIDINAVPLFKEGDRLYLEERKHGESV
jgi:hypothetical protein